MQLTIQNRQAKVDVVPSASSLVIKALKGEYLFCPARRDPNPAQSPHATARRRRTSSTAATSPSTRSSTLHAQCDQSPSRRTSLVVSRRSSAQRRALAAPSTASPHTMLSTPSTRGRLKCQKSRLRAHRTGPYSFVVFHSHLTFHWHCLHCKTRNSISSLVFVLAKIVHSHLHNLRGCSSVGSRAFYVSPVPVYSYSLISRCTNDLISRWLDMLSFL